MLEIMQWCVLSHFGQVLGEQLEVLVGGKRPTKGPLSGRGARKEFSWAGQTEVGQYVAYLGIRGGRGTPRTATTPWPWPWKNQGQLVKIQGETRKKHWKSLVFY